MAYVGCLLIST